MNDRYLYFPMLGIAGLLCFLCTTLRSRIHSHILKKMVVSSFIGVVVALSVASHIRGYVWKDTITLFSDMVAKVPNQYITWDGLAEGYRAAGDMERALQYYEMASKHGFLREIESYHLAQIYLERGDYEKAYNHIWGLLLKSSKSGNKDGFLLLGEYYYLTEAYSEAEKQLLTYLETMPNSQKALFTLGKVYYMLGDRARAKKLILRASESGDETPDLLHALSCLESDKECDSIESDSPEYRRNN
jgi:tetratricopeptide (TPR) repeat protein